MKKLLFSALVVFVLSVGCGVTTATTGSLAVTSDVKAETIAPADSSRPGWNESDAEVATVTGYTVTLYSIAAEDGNVRSGGFAADYDDLIVGDDGLNKARQAFLSFDVSGIPAGATIKSASLDISRGTKEGRPFGGAGTAPLGLLGIYSHQYGTSISAYAEHWGWSSPLTREDFTVGFPSGAIKTYSASSPPAGLFSNAELISALQARVDAGDSRFQLRLQFKKQTNHNGKMEALVLADPELVVTYQD